MINGEVIVQGYVETRSAASRLFLNGRKLITAGSEDHRESERSLVMSLAFKIAYYEYGSAEAPSVLGFVSLMRLIELFPDQAKFAVLP